MKHQTSKAFLTVEVLISIIIIFTAIVTISSSIKSVVMFSNKSSQYQSKYIVLKSLLNYIDKLDLKLTFITTSYSILDIKLKELNGYQVTTQIKKVREEHIQASDEFGNFTNTKAKSILLKVKFLLTKNNFTKEYEVYLTKVYE
jgi:hypothetical protein